MKAESGRLRALSHSYAIVTSTFALIVALGGTGFAVAGLGHHSVGTKQLKNGAVTTAKLHAKAVTSTKVKPGSLTGKDIARNQGVPIAWAHVTPAGSVIAADSKGITSANVTLESTSAYCFHGLPFTVHNGITTEEYDSVDGVQGAAAFAKGNPDDDCATAQAEVATTVANTFAPSGFYVYFY
jgi:hypothetical protein